MSQVGPARLKGVSAVGETVSVTWNGASVTLIVLSIQWKDKASITDAENGDGGIEGHGADGEEQEIALTLGAKDDTLANVQALGKPGRFDVVTIEDSALDEINHDWNYKDGWNVNLRKDYAEITMNLVCDADGEAYATPT